MQNLLLPVFYFHQTIDIAASIFLTDLHFTFLTYSQDMITLYNIHIDNIHNICSTVQSYIAYKPIFLYWDLKEAVSTASFKLMITNLAFLLHMWSYNISFSIRTYITGSNFTSYAWRRRPTCTRHIVVHIGCLDTETVGSGSQRAMKTVIKFVLALPAVMIRREHRVPPCREYCELPVLKNFFKLLFHI